MGFLPELGQVALILALLAACMQALLPMLGAQRGVAAVMAVAPAAAAPRPGMPAAARAARKHAARPLAPASARPISPLPDCSSVP